MGVGAEKMQTAAIEQEQQKYPVRQKKFPTTHIILCSGNIGPYCYITKKTLEVPNFLLYLATINQIYI